MNKTVKGSQAVFKVFVIQIWNNEVNTPELYRLDMAKEAELPGG
jgi:hypothetical protein